MFNVTGGEVIIVLVLALVVLGPEKLPDMLRKVGKLYGELRRMTSGFQAEFEETFAEPLREFRETATQARDMVARPMDAFKEDEVIEGSAASATSDGAALPVASGSEPPYAPVVTAVGSNGDDAIATSPSPSLPPPAAALPPPTAPLPPPATPLWTQPTAAARMDPWATEKTGS
jgi:sec-independent protein translocase protein TatB